MLANEMYKEFQLRYEGGRIQNKTFDEREVTDWLNTSQLALVKERYAAWKNRPQIGYGNEEVRNSELIGLVTGTKAVNATKFIQGTKDNGALLGPDKDAQPYKSGNDLVYPDDMFGVYTPIPDECLYILHEDVATQEGGTNTNIKTNVPTISISMKAEYDNLIYNPYKYPYKNLVWSLGSGAFTLNSVTSGTFGNTVKGMTGYNPQYVGPYRGTWSSGTTYAQHDNVLYNGVYYRSVQGTNLNHAVTLTAWWEPILIDTARCKYLIPGKGWQIIEYRISYIKLPADIQIDLVTPANQVHCELGPELHKEIVLKAVQMASASITPDVNKYQVNSAEDIKQQ